MYLEGRNYRSVIVNAVLLYMHNGTALYSLYNEPCIFYSSSDNNYFSILHYYKVTILMIAL